MNKYNAIGISEFKVHTRFLNYYEKTGWTPFGKERLEQPLTPEEAGYLVNTGKDLLNTLTENVKFKGIGNYYSYEEQMNLSNITVYFLSNQGFTPEHIRAICEKNNLDAIVTIEIGYGLWEYLTYFQSYGAGAKALSKIARAYFTASVNTGCVVLFAKVYNKNRKFLAQYTGSISGDKKQTFELRDGSFHLNESTTSIVESARSEFIKTMRAIFVTQTSK